MNLSFKRNGWLDEYHGNGVHFRHGETQDVEDKEAKRLLKDFPENFSAAIDAPPADKQIRGAANKGK